MHAYEYYLSRKFVCNLKIIFLTSTEFCPVDCDWSKELVCGGDWDPKTGQQMSADYCIPNKNGDCPASCPAKCGENDMICPGKMGGPGGCQSSDYCHHGSKYFSDSLT